LNKKRQTLCSRYGPVYSVIIVILTVIKNKRSKVDKVIIDFVCH